MAFSSALKHQAPRQHERSTVSFLAQESQNPNPNLDRLIAVIVFPLMLTVAIAERVFDEVTDVFCFVFDPVPKAATMDGGEVFQAQAFVQSFSLKSGGRHCDV